MGLSLAKFESVKLLLIVTSDSILGMNQLFSIKELIHPTVINNRFISRMKSLIARKNLTDSNARLRTVQ